MTNKVNAKSKEKIVSMAKISGKWQITLPTRVRRRMGFNAGDTIIFDFLGDQLVIRKARNIAEYFNTLPPLDRPFKEKIGEIMAEDIWGGR